MKRPSIRLLYLSLAAVLVLLTACGDDDFGFDPATATPAALPAPGDALRDTVWILTAIDGGPALDDTMVTLEFNDQAGGYSGCNWYGGAYELAGETIRFEDMAMTARLCIPQSIVDQETSYHELLGQAVMFQLDAPELTFLNANGQRILAFTRREPAAVDPADLVETSWQLVSFDGVPWDGPPGILTFDDESSFSTHDDCYNIGGSYAAEGDRLAFPSSEAHAHACLQPMEWQTHPANLPAAIGDVAWYRFNDDGAELELIHVDGRSALFDRLSDMPSDDAWSVTWVLDSIVVDGEAEPPIEGSEITLTIANPSLRLNEGQAVTGKSGCNTYQAVMTAGVDTLTFSDIVVTEMACPEPPGIMEQELRFLGLLGDVTRHNIYDDNALQLVTGDGTTLVFHPVR